jgi:hypothetical protein
MDIEKVYTIDRSIEELFEVFQDLNLYGAVHPLIRGVNFLETNDLGKVYQIVEQPYSCLPFRIKYKAIVSLNSKEIQYIIKGIPWTEAQIKYSFETNELNNKIAITFQLQIGGKLPRFVQKVLQGKMMKAQDQLMDVVAK